MPGRPVIFGTRGSPLAMAQARDAVSRAVGAGHCSADEAEIRVIRTVGDINTSVPVSEIGGKGVFCKELEQALLDGEIDVAVHSMKDLPVKQPEGLTADCVLPRADPRDALICASAGSVRDLPDGSVIGTSSLRRSAQLLSLNPKLRTVTLRGNLDTRLGKVSDGAVAGAVLAMAGLTRLGRLSAGIKPIPVSDMLPAPAQGCVCLERREDDAAAAALTAGLNDAASDSRARAERALLSGLGGDCGTPLGALAEIDDDQMVIRGELLSPDGTVRVSMSLRGPAAEAAELGLELARLILSEFGSRD